MSYDAGFGDDFGEGRYGAAAGGAGGGGGADDDVPEEEEEEQEEESLNEDVDRLRRAVMSEKVGRQWCPRDAAPL